MLLVRENLTLESKQRRDKWWVRLEQPHPHHYSVIEAPAEVLIGLVSEWWMKHDGMSGDYWRGYQDAIKEVKELLEKEVG